MVLHPEVAAEESYAKRNLDKKKNERSQYSHVTLPSQLTDKKARAAIRRQEEQFALSARSYTAAEGVNTDRWAEVNCLLLKLERGVTEIPRYSGLPKTRNIVPVNTTSKGELPISLPQVWNLLVAMKFWICTRRRRMLGSRPIKINQLQRLQAIPIVVSFMKRLTCQYPLIRLLTKRLPPSLCQRLVDCYSIANYTYNDALEYNTIRVLID